MNELIDARYDGHEYEVFSSADFSECLYWSSAKKRIITNRTSADDSSCCPFVDSLVSSKIYTIIWRMEIE